MKSTKWIAIVGEINHKDGLITHIPTRLPEGQDAPANDVPPHSLSRSSIEFDQGSISLEVWLEEENGKCLFGLSSGDGAEVYAGLNNLGAAYGFAVFRNNKWEPGGGAGVTPPPIKQWLDLELTVHGSNLVLNFEGVDVAKTTQWIQKAPLSLLLQSSQEVRVRNIKVNSATPECFVVMQFTEEFNNLYQEVIKPTCEDYGYTVTRADDTYTNGLIIEDITRAIRESSLVIADITPDNPNVFYEVGFAHGIDKPTILLSDRERQKLPFDVSGFRTLFYDNTIGGKSEVEQRLKKHLENIGV